MQADRPEEASTNLSVWDQMRKDVYGHREDDGAVVLRRDAVQGLEVAQLKEEFS